MNKVALTINGRKIEANSTMTILEAAKASNIHIPSLCNLQGLKPEGACRICLVEVEGARTLVASCVCPVSEGMVVKSNTERVRKARKAMMQLILSEHDGNCQVCNRNGDCELQATAREVGIEIEKFEGEKTSGIFDDSTPGLVRDSAKCIKCRRCVTVCREIQHTGALFPQKRGFATQIGPPEGLALASVACVQCGQCAAVCPVGAIIEKSNAEDVWNLLDDPEIITVVQTAPAIRAALGECFGYEPGTLVTGKMTTALKHLGFDAVFDTNFTADLTIMEEGTELLTRLKKALVGKEKVALPMFTSCSPGWIKYAEYYAPDMLDNLSTCKSPQQMMGTMIKTYYAEKMGHDPAKVKVVSIMPCTAKKFECQRPEMSDSGFQDVDYVLTTRELGELIIQGGIDFRRLPDSKMDAPLGLSSGAADIFANTGGVMEAAIRTVYEIVTGRTLPFKNLHVTPIAGLQGVKEASLKLENVTKEWSFLEGVEVRVAVAHGLGNAYSLIERVRNGEQYHFIEVMTCPGGCIGGGGQPRFTDNETRLRRIEAIYKEDEGKELRLSHENPDIMKIYKEFLKKPNSEKAHHLLHTHYKQRALID
ncbi:MAG: iron hydrogenase small subunit [Spirochaetales bacterium]|nr:iron hydrogenase small subunit [Spirochaetales bacterium]